MYWIRAVHQFHTYLLLYHGGGIGITRMISGMNPIHISYEQRSNYEFFPNPLEL